MWFAHSFDYKFTITGQKCTEALDKLFTSLKQESRAFVSKFFS